MHVASVYKLESYGKAIIWKSELLSVCPCVALKYQISSKCLLRCDIEIGIVSTVWPLMEVSHTLCQYSLIYSFATENL